MGALIHPGEVKKPVDLDLHSGAAHQIHLRSSQAIATERILKEVHPHPGTRARGQRICETARDLPACKDEVLESDGALCAPDCVEHRREDFRAVLQCPDMVSVEQRRSKQLSDRADESVIPHRVIRFDPPPDFFPFGKEIAGDNHTRRRAEQCTHGRGRAMRAGVGETFFHFSLSLFGYAPRVRSCRLRIR